MESLVSGLPCEAPASLPDRAFWRGRRVLLTGHTGFKGSWLLVWLRQLGAEVAGLALAPSTDPNLFDLGDLGALCESHSLVDVRDAVEVRTAFAEFNPEIVLHLAAQPLVGYSYDNPLETFATNVMGTAHVLDAARRSARARVVLVVTTDKCYREQAWPWPYRESDTLGGHDPYSASKACAELVSDSFRSAYANSAHECGVASARAGNVIGGGDFTPGRLIPDVLTALRNEDSLLLRHPLSVRPWQHVLDPLAGYLVLVERVHVDPIRYGEAWNFGPSHDRAATVEEVAAYLCARARADGCRIPQAQILDASRGRHEAAVLRLDSTKARARLGWRTRLSLEQALDWTWAFHQEWRSGAAVLDLMRQQIAAFETLSAPP